MYSIHSCLWLFYLFFFNDTATTEIYTLSLHDALPIFWAEEASGSCSGTCFPTSSHPSSWWARSGSPRRSEEHTSELQSQFHLVCRLLLEKKKKKNITYKSTIKKKKKIKI